jgi:lysyl-tRNA synthetase class II
MEHIKYQITHFNGNRWETMADSTQPQEPTLWHRDKYAGEITDKDYNNDLTVAGWLHEIRNLGGIAFILLRDRTGILQVTAIKKEMGNELLK